jgi:acetyltransferase-like isoleucine patch superfamily enzyme
MSGKGHILGDYWDQQKIALSKSYFIERDCWVDVRVPGMITIDPSANISHEVKLVVESHDVHKDSFGVLTSRPIVIGPKAWICAFCILYNCTIGEGAIVATGSVVRSMNVKPWTMVAGNPAVPIKRYDHATDKWIKI